VERIGKKKISRKEKRRGVKKVRIGKGTKDQQRQKKLCRWEKSQAKKIKAKKKKKKRMG